MTRAALVVMVALLSGCARQDCPDVRHVDVKPAAEPAKPGSALSRLRLRPAPEAEKPVPPPPVVHPPQAKPKAVPKRVEKRKREKSRREAKPVKQPAPRAAGPDLPYPCWLVRLHAGGKTQAQLDALARQHGVKLTPKQERQALACLNKGK
jgi:hypothetical protein